MECTSIGSPQFTPSLREMLRCRSHPAEQIYLVAGTARNNAVGVRVLISSEDTDTLLASPSAARDAQRLPNRATRARHAGRCDNRPVDHSADEARECPRDGACGHRRGNDSARCRVRCARRKAPSAYHAHYHVRRIADEDSVRVHGSTARGVREAESRCLRCRPAPAPPAGAPDGAPAATSRRNSARKWTAACNKAKWELILNRDPRTRTPTRYKLTGTLYRQHVREGRWTIVRGASSNPNAIVLSTAHKRPTRNTASRKSRREHTVLPGQEQEPHGR